jgi:hypothetical protein
MNLVEHNPKTVEPEYKDKEAQRKGSNSISAKHMTARRTGHNRLFRCNGNHYNRWTVVEWVYASISASLQVSITHHILDHCEKQNEKHNEDAKQKIYNYQMQAIYSNAIKTIKSQLLRFCFH